MLYTEEDNDLIKIFFSVFEIGIIILNIEVRIKDNDFPMINSTYLC